MSLTQEQIKRATDVFRILASVEFNHKKRTDPQQNFMEPLEVVSVAVGLKPSFCAGLSDYHEPFCKNLIKISGNIGLQFARTPTSEIRVQLKAFAGHNISLQLLSRFAELLLTKEDKRTQLLWLYLDHGLKTRIVDAASGKISLGETLGYPKCCTDAYLQNEADLMETEMEFYSKNFGAKTDDDFIALYKKSAPIEGKFMVKLQTVRDEITTRQAWSINKHPFVHFISCGRCLDDPNSPAALLNNEMRELAHAMNSTFARKFTSYADSYFSMFQESR